MPPIEVQATLQYATIYFPSLTHTVGAAHPLTVPGFICATVLMLLFCWLNVIGTRHLLRSNFLMVIFKVGAIVITALALMTLSFHPANLSSHSFSPEGFRGIFAAIASGGIAFAFTGFRHAIELAAETKNPQRAIPFAIIGCITCCFILYVLLQLAFLVSVDPSAIQLGWQHISFSGDVGPFIGIAALLGVGWLVAILYANAVVSPAGAALIYVTSTARITYAMGENGYFPQIFTKLNRNAVPAWGILFNFSVGMLLFLPFPGWQAMVSFLVSAVVVSYGMGPISLIALRLQIPDQERPFKLRGGIIIPTLSFYLCNLIAYWSGWVTIKKLMIAMLIGVVIFSLFNRNRKEMDLHSALWLIPYFIGLALISYLGTFGGGVGIIPFGLDFLVVGLFSLAILTVAVASRLPSERTLRYIT